MKKQTQLPLNAKSIGAVFHYNVIRYGFWTTSAHDIIAAINDQKSVKDTTTSLFHNDGRNVRLAIDLTSADSVFTNAAYRNWWPVRLPHLWL